MRRYWQMMHFISLLFLLFSNSGFSFSPFPFFSNIFRLSRCYFTKNHNNDNNKLFMSIQRVETEPILVVTEPLHNCKIHIVGVSHGDQVSAKLVEVTIKKVRPSAVVLELCADRYLAISLESSLAPTANTTILEEYNHRQRRRQSYREQNPSKLAQGIGTIKDNAQFIKSQGIVAGSFLSMSVLLSIFQRLLGVIKKGDEEEFLTAMKVAKKYNIPIRLADAPQHETLQNLNDIFSLETINPSSVFRAVCGFLFSSVGFETRFLPWKNLSTDDQKRYKRTVPESTVADNTNEDFKDWINIIDIYRKKKEMMKSLAPAFAMVLLAMLFSAIPEIGLADSDSLPGMGAERLSLLEANTWLLSIWRKVFNLLNDDFVSGANYVVVNALSALIMMRFAKIIGTDRDRYMAKKIQEFSREFPGAKLVVVVGMLHVNGIASWLEKGNVIEPKH